MTLAVLVELYFLIANFLDRASPCSNAAKALREDLSRHQLLGTAVDWTGATRSANFEDWRRRYFKLPDDQLVRLLNQRESLLSEAVKPHGAELKPSLLSPVTPKVEGA